MNLENHVHLRRAGHHAGAWAQSCTIKVGRVAGHRAHSPTSRKDTPWVDDHKVGPINKAGGPKVGKPAVQDRVQDLRQQEHRRLG